MRVFNHAFSTMRVFLWRKVLNRMGRASYEIQREPVKQKPIGHEDGASVHKCVEVVFYFFAGRALCIVLDDLEQSPSLYRSKAVKYSSHEDVVISIVFATKVWIKSSPMVSYMSTCTQSKSQSIFHEAFRAPTAP